MDVTIDIMAAVDSTLRARFFRCIILSPYCLRAWALPQQSAPAASAWRAFPGALHLCEQILDPRRFASSLPPPPTFQGLFSTKILYTSLCFCEFSPIFPRIDGHNAEACQESARFPGIPVMPVLFPCTADLAGAIKGPLPPSVQQKKKKKKRVVSPYVGSDPFFVFFTPQTGSPGCSRAGGPAHRRCAGFPARRW